MYVRLYTLETISAWLKKFFIQFVEINQHSVRRVDDITLSKIIDLFLQTIMKECRLHFKLLNISVQIRDLFKNNSNRNHLYHKWEILFKINILPLNKFFCNQYLIGSYFDHMQLSIITICSSKKKRIPFAVDCFSPRPSSIKVWHHLLENSWHHVSNQNLRVCLDGVIEIFWRI